MTIDEILRPEDVNTALRADAKTAAIEEMLSTLRGDARVVNWEELRSAVIERDAPAIEHEGRAVCIAHGRTRAVTGLTMAAGISQAGVICPGTNIRVHLLFVAGIPTAVDSEYLRIVGSIVRVCHDPKHFHHLCSAKNGRAFVETLAEAAGRL